MLHSSYDLGNLPHFECSAKEAIRVDQVFLQVARLALQQEEIESEQNSQMYVMSLSLRMSFDLL
jgi:hypothetical protein